MNIYCYPEKNQTSVLRYFASGGGPRTSPAAEFQQKGLPQISRFSLIGLLRSPARSAGNNRQALAKQWRGSTFFFRRKKVGEAFYG
jgi:hypothetical protein